MNGYHLLSETIPSSSLILNRRWSFSLKNCNLSLNKFSFSFFKISHILYISSILSSWSLNLSSYLCNYFFNQIISVAFSFSLKETTWSSLWRASSALFSNSSYLFYKRYFSLAKLCFSSSITKISSVIDFNFPCCSSTFFS